MPVGLQEFLYACRSFTEIQNMMREIGRKIEGGEKQENSFRGRRAKILFQASV